MAARQVARQFCRLGEVHSRSYGRQPSNENDRKLTADNRVGSKSRLMDNPGLNKARREQRIATRHSSLR